MLREPSAVGAVVGMIPTSSRLLASSPTSDVPDNRREDVGIIPTTAPTAEGSRSIPAPGVAAGTGEVVGPRDGTEPPAAGDRPPPDARPRRCRRPPDYFQSQIYP